MLPSSDDVLDGLLRRAQAAWPEWGPPSEAFRGWLRARGALDGQALNVEDGYLAFAASQGLPGAIEAFERTVLGPLAASLGGARLSRDERDEALQRVRVRLFTRDKQGVPRIAEYRARGSLAGWVKVIAGRAAIDLRRETRERPDGGEAAARSHVAETFTPEMELLKRRYGPMFQAALSAALSDVPADQLELLGLAAIECLRTSQIAARLGLGVSTVRRRLADARRAVLDGTRARLGITDSEFRTLGALVESQLQLSLMRLRGGPT